MKPKTSSKLFPRCNTAFDLIRQMLLSGLFLTVASLHAATPPNPTVELRFPEGPDGTGGNGVTSTNTGTLSGYMTFALDTLNPWETNTLPVFTNLVPTGTYVPGDNSFSVNMGTVGGNSTAGNGGRAVDSKPSLTTIGAYNKLTICGWFNANSLPGVRSVSLAFAMETAGASGFDLEENLDGTVGLFVNGYENDPPYSTVRLTASPSYATNNWIFLAVTYDPTLASNQLKYYFGRPNKLAALDLAATYVPSSVLGSNVDYTGALSVGNVSDVDGARNATGSVSHEFRGLMDEIKIYTNVLTLDEVQQAQLNSAVTPVVPTILTQPLNAAATVGQNATFNVDATGSGLVTYQWTTNGANVPGATNTSFTFNSVVLAQSGTIVRVGVTNATGGLLSSNVTLTVLPADPHVGSFSLMEGSGSTTTNVGSLAGRGIFKVNGGFPLFISTNVPTGPFAPSPIYNPFSLYCGLTGGNRAVDVTNTLVSPLGALGSMNGLTICGWINSANWSYRSTSTGRGVGVVNASLGGANGGFVLAYRDNTLSGNTGGYGNNGRLALYVNDWPTGDPTASQLSSVNTIPLNTNLPAANWIFFAVTYDGTAITNNLNFYFGSPTNAAALDPVSPTTYIKGVIANTGPVSIGNHNSTGDGVTAMPGNPTGRTVGGDNGTAYRGLMDEVKIFTKVLSLAEIQAEQIAPAVPTLLVYSNSGPNLDLSWSTRVIFPYQLKWQTNVAAATWYNVPIGETVSGNIHKVSVPQTNDMGFFRIIRQ